MPWDDEKQEQTIENIQTCPSCKTPDIVLAHGPKKAKVLLVGEFPGDDEIIKGIPFSGATGRVLKVELASVGLDFKAFRVTNLHIHKPNKNKDCFEIGVKQVIKEAIGRKVVVLIGSDVVNYFVKLSVSDVNGLVVKSPYLDVPVLMACVQPATAFHGKGVGEIRFAINKLNNILEEVDG